MQAIRPDVTGWTIAMLIVIAIGMALAVAVVLWGMRAKRARQATERTVAADSQEFHGALPAVDPQPLIDEPAIVRPVDDDMPRVADLAPPPAPPETSDDLTQLKGVGPKLAVRLGELGVTRYAQIADLSPADADALDAQLGTFRGRLERDRWIEQANYLARGDRDGFEAAFGRL